MDIFMKLNTYTHIVQPSMAGQVSINDTNLVKFYVKNK